MANEQEIAKLQLIIDLINEDKEAYADDVISQIDTMLSRPLGEQMRVKLSNMKSNIEADKTAYSDSKIAFYEQKISELGGE